MATASTDLPLGGISVLAIDDDRSTLEALTLVLESRGARVYGLPSAAAGLAFGDANPPPDVIVSDVSMAGTDGLAMLAAIRAAERAAHRAPTPAVAVSGYASAEDQARAVAAGYQVLVPKPVNIEMLVRTIRDLAARGKRSPAVE